MLLMCDVCTGVYQLLNLYCPYAIWFGSKRTDYVDIVRGRSAGKEVTIEFTLLGSLDV
jgi:pantothenate synthetase